MNGKATTAQGVALGGLAGTAGVATGEILLSVQGAMLRSAARNAGSLALRGDVTLAGGRSCELVKDLIGPANSVVKGSPGRVFVTNDRGQVILDITRDRVKPVIPGSGFGQKRMPTRDELEMLRGIYGAK